MYTKECVVREALNLLVLLLISINHYRSLVLRAMLVGCIMCIHHASVESNEAFALYMDIGWLSKTNLASQINTNVECQHALVQAYHHKTSKQLFMPFNSKYKIQFDHALRSSMVESLQCICALNVVIHNKK